MRWIVDTSAWARRDVPQVGAQLRELLEAGDEFVLAPPVELELLRQPQGDGVGLRRAELEASMLRLVVDDDTFRLAADAMEALALSGATAHRLPVPDLVTAALAHQHRCGVVHADAHFEALRAGSGLEFESRRLDVTDADAGDAHPAADQRALKRELAQLLHQLPVDAAQACLRRAVDDAAARGSAQQA